jgi:hypothetical protein
MDYTSFLRKLPTLYQNWGSLAVSPVSLQLEAVVKQVKGTNLPHILQLLNLAVGLLAPSEVYCEVGCFQGRSLIAALLNHPAQMAYAVDSFRSKTLRNWQKTWLNLTLVIAYLSALKTFESFLLSLTILS